MPPLPITIKSKKKKRSIGSDKQTTLNIDKLFLNTVTTERGENSTIEEEETSPVTTVAYWSVVPVVEILPPIDLSAVEVLPVHLSQSRDTSKRIRSDG